MKKFILFILKTIWAIIGLIAVYLLLGFLIPYIEVPADKVSEPKTKEIYILTNGVHTDIVLPIRTEQNDWTKILPAEDTKSQRTDFNYIGIGWGDKGFYLDTPEWSDLKFSTAFYAAFWLSDSAMHCTYYEKISENKDCKKIMLTEKQYGDLVKFVADKFDYDSQGKVINIKTDAAYGENDAFYEANGSYSFLYTCNTWVNQGLKVAGQKAALWTPTDFGIFRHYR